MKLADVLHFSTFYHTNRGRLQSASHASPSVAKVAKVSSFSNQEMVRHKGSQSVPRVGASA